MVRAKKAASGIEAPSRAKPTTKSDTDDSRSVPDDHRKTKASAGQYHKASRNQRQSKKPAPRPRHDTPDADVDGDAIEEEEEGGGGGGEEEGEEEEDEDNNDGNASHDPIEDNDDQENNDDDEEEEEEEEDTYEAAETKMLKLKIKLHLIELKSKIPGGQNSQDVRHVRRMTNEVRELRERLANEDDQASDDGNAKSSKKWWAIHGIIKETAYHYLIVWKGRDEHGQPWDDWWVAKREVNAAARHDWAALRASEAKDQREKRKEFEAVEE